MTTTPEMDRMDKFTLCVKRCQEGKTFTCISTINSRIEHDEKTKRSVHVIYTMNTLLANKQFVNRLRRLENTYGRGSVVVFASNYSGEFRHANNATSIKGMFMTDPDNFPRVIVQCSNYKRFGDGVELIAAIDMFHSGKVRIFAYYDELHKYINGKIRTQLETIHGLENVYGILALTATPSAIYSTGVWSRIITHYLDNIDSPNYIGVKDHEFVLIDKAGDIPQTIDNVIDDIAEVKKAKRSEIDFLKYLAYTIISRDILTDGSLVFAPAMYRQATHGMVRSLIFKICKEAVVVLLNGSEKSLQYYDDEELITRAMQCKDDEACNEVAALVNKENLKGRPLVYTGFICMGMGQTLTCEELGPFTSAILPHTELSNDDIYQLFGRTCGNMGHWRNIHKTKIYCPEIVMQRCSEMERLARTLVEENNGCETSLETINEIIASGEFAHAVIGNKRKNAVASEPKMNVLYSPVVFDTPDLAKSWARDNLTKNASTFGLHGSDGGDGNTHFKYRGKPRAIVSYDDTLKHSDNGWAQGATGSPRVMPVYHANNIYWLVVYNERFMKK